MQEEENFAVEVAFPREDMPPAEVVSAARARLYISCGGADSPRPVKLRKKGDGQWCLWEQYLLTAIIPPKANDPWA